MSGDIAAFVRARLDEDEQTAGAAPGRCWFDSGDGWVMNEDMHLFEADDGPLLAHIARHDPARVLRDIDAKRRILAEHREMTPGWCVTCDVPGDQKGSPHGCATLRLLAAPYVDHPDYRPEWAPDA